LIGVVKLPIVNEVVVILLYKEITREEGFKEFTFSATPMGDPFDFGFGEVESAIGFVGGGVSPKADEAPATGGTDEPFELDNFRMVGQPRIHLECVGFHCHSLYSGNTTWIGWSSNWARCRAIRFDTALRWITFVIADFPTPNSSATCRNETP